MVNSDAESALSPPQMLAIAYAPREIRERFRWLLSFDNRLRDVLEKAREPLIAQLRLAWWRDVLGKNVGDRPKGEPLLAMMVEDEILVATALKLVDATESRIDQPDRASLESALAICDAYGRWIDGDAAMAEKLAFAWTGRGDAIMTPVPRQWRALSILTLAARLEREGGRAGGIRLVLHALTGR